MDGIRFWPTTFSRTSIVPYLSLMVMSVAVFFLLTPGYEGYGIAASATSLLWQWMRSIRQFANWQWFVGMYVPVGILAITTQLHDPAYILHLRSLAAGFMVFGAAYSLVRERDAVPQQHILCWLALPFVMHLGFFLTAIPHHLLDTSVGSPVLRIESMRHVAKIGPKLLGQALALLIPLCGFMLLYAQQLGMRRLCACLFILACLGLALLDSRGSYLALVVGLVLAGIIHRRLALHNAAIMQAVSKRLKQFVCGIALLAIALAIAVGWYRFKIFSESAEAAWHNEQYISWITPETWVKELCPPARERCIVDNSMYLRLSWIKFGMRVIADHPLGIGPSAQPLAKALTQYYPEVTAKHDVHDNAHSGLIDIGLSYGIPGIVGFLTLCVLPLVVVWRRAYASDAPAILPLLACLWGVCITRAITDGLAMSLWLMAWVYAGFIFMLLRRTKTAA